MSIILTKGMLQTNKKGMVANNSLYIERFTCITVNIRVIRTDSSVVLF